MFRIGIGYDTHVLLSGRPLILGGVNIPYTRGLLGHSDADVLLHAICDALLGAAAKGDLGEHFPPNDPAFKGIASTELIKRVMQLVTPAYAVVNIDAVVICQEPKLSAYKKAMETVILQLTQAQQVTVKATTTEGMNDEGRGKCISAQAVCLLMTTDVISN